MTYYAETGPRRGIDKSTLVICFHEDGLIQRYDASSKEWVTDYEMSQIFTGDIECEPISEQQANEIIKRIS
ncbi:MAG: hypothetical protein RSC10_09945 [Longicatena sp.]